MNANELADELNKYKGIATRDAATMLRQQQAEIEALKQIIDANNLSQNIGQFVKPTNEPVAWKAFEELPFSDQYILRWVREGDEYVNRMTKEIMEEFKSLVEKELTDEEINKLAEEHLDMDWQTGVIEFARAILRKANEK